MKNYVKNFYIFFLIIFSGLGIFAFRNSDSSILVLIISLIYFRVYKVYISKTFFTLVFIWIVYAFLNTIAISSFYPSLFFYYPIMFFAAYVAIKIYGIDIFIKYEKIIYYLTLISFIFMLWHIFDVSSFYRFMDIFNINKYNDINVGSRIRYSIGIYSVNHMDSWGIPRNCGFTWEPGPFGSFIVVAIFFNMLRTQFRLRNNYVFFVLLLGLISTQSTTAVIAFFFVLVWIMLNNPIAKKALLITLPFFVALVVFLFINVSFLRTKIIEDINQSDEIDELVDLSIQSRGSYAPGRFASFKITYMDFIKRPLLGYGANADLRWTNQFGADIRPVSGVGNLLAQYGLFGFILWFIGVRKSSLFFKNRYKFTKTSIVWLMIIVSISIGFSIVISPIFFTFYLLPFFYIQGVRTKSKLKRIE
ncbi:hypothetical protein SDC9_45041 [bioreactor metagenome]|uniref:O-antigen ligase-related domain-containing protein n=1 Tax=bioreactor metagenome TaxID=1076179 RepID=A0A644W543_9ZZZZ|nr:hypothetical protein [Paludibacter sp.]